MSRELPPAAVAAIGAAVPPLLVAGESGRGLLISFGVDLAALVVTALAAAILFRWLRGRQ